MTGLKVLPERRRGWTPAFAGVTVGDTAGMQTLGVSPKSKLQKKAPKPLKQLTRERNRTPPHSSPKSSNAPRSTPLPMRISRLPEWLGGLTTPSFSIRSTSDAALL